ncbi:MAG TPA: molecular chaperone TorD family protein [Candidatus Binatia bacterium]
MELLSLDTASEPITANRSRLYQLLVMAFAFPDEDFFTAVADGIFAATVAGTCAALPYDLSDVARLDLGGAEIPYADFESEYIRLFDVGAAGPPCPLYGGVYIGDRMKTMEDATRFYNYFHLRLSPQMHELPDHITTELEFLHYLTFRETELRQQGLDPSSLLRAERDFLARHLCRWLPRMQARLAKQECPPFFPALVRFAIAFFDADQQYAAAAAGS